MIRKIANLSGAVLLGAVIAQAQFVSKTPQARSTKVEAVQYLFPEQVTLPAGKATAVALHFRVAEGLHINSHNPKDDFLIPTAFSIPNSTGVKLDSATYPDGAMITLAADPTTKLSVYTGDFTINTRLVAAAGNHLVQGKLHYQACDQEQCMPPKDITVAIDVIGR
jgi:DsbC/DsbD-like thiol-disulfide interchange protein